MRRGNELTQAIDEIVGERIHILREAKGLTLKQLSQEIGVTFQQLFKYEKCINKISCGRLYLIAKALKRPVSYFFGDR